MKKLHFFLVLLVVLQTSFVSAQKVSNITYHQEQNTIIVSYDLETKTPCKVNLYVSTNGGTTWQGPLTKVSGVVGAKIASGSHSIIWKVLEEFEELRGDKIQFQVRADGENIETVVIGTQEWTKKNLNVSKYRNGDIIPEIKDPKKFENLTTGAWCYYNNDPKNGAIYGKLYNWYAVNDPRGLAPKGYHIPSDNDWDILRNYLGGKEVAGGKMKEKATNHWKSPNKDATNESNFTALPGGCRTLFGEFDGFGYRGYWWSCSSGGNYGESNPMHMTNYNGKLSRVGTINGEGSSVRCLKD